MAVQSKIFDEENAVKVDQLKGQLADARKKLDETMESLNAMKTRYDENEITAERNNFLFKIEASEASLTMMIKERNECKSLAEEQLVALEDTKTSNLKLNDRIKDLQQTRLDAIENACVAESQVKRLENELEKLSDKLGTTTQRLCDMEDKFDEDAIAAERYDFMNKLNDSEDRTAIATEENADLQAEYDTVYDQLSAIEAKDYESQLSELSLLNQRKDKAIVSQSSITDSLKNTIDSLRLLSDSRSSKIDSLTAEVSTRTELLKEGANEVVFLRSDLKRLTVASQKHVANRLP